MYNVPAARARAAAPAARARAEENDLSSQYIPWGLSSAVAAARFTMLALVVAVAASASTVTTGTPSCNVTRKPCPQHPRKTFCPTSPDKHQCSEAPCNVTRLPCPAPAPPGFMWCPTDRVMSKALQCEGVATCIDASGVLGACGPGREFCGEPFAPETSPAFHLMDQHGCGENDPNGPVFDPVHGVVHHFYQIHLAAPPGKGPDYGHVS